MEELNLNLSKCLVSKTGFTGNTIHNICSGEVQFVPHGAFDYVAGAFLIAFMAASVVAIAGIVVALFLSFRSS